MNISILNKEEVFGKELKIYGDIENPLFLAKDIAEMIEYDKSSINKMINNIDDLEKVRNIVPTPGGAQETWFLTEDGLYEVLMQSRKPIAKQFKKKIKEILKSIRKNGMYVIDDLLDNPDLAIQALTKLKEERKKIKLLETENKVKDQQILELKPKATYYDLILQCKNLIPVTIIAKDYGMSGKQLNDLLHKLGVQYKQGGEVWLLYQKHADKGYTHTKTQNYNKSDGTQGAKTHTYWTQKGRLFIYNLLKENNHLPNIEKEYLTIAK